MHTERFALWPNLAYPDEKGFGENSNVDCLGLATGSQMTNFQTGEAILHFPQAPRGVTWMKQRID